MKYFGLCTLFSLCFSLAAFACSCGGEGSLCDYLQEPYFLNNNGMVCIAERTGNEIDSFPWAVEMRLIDLLYGTIQPGSSYAMNTDSTFWILGSNDSCDDFPGPATVPFVLAPAYFNLNFGGVLDASGYSLTLCVHDKFPYKNTMMGPIINTHYFFDGAVWEMDTVNAGQLPQIVADCASCSLNLDLSATHNFPTTYRTNSTINSTAYVNANVVYNAGERIHLDSGFKTNQAIRFGASIDGCN